jgi:hypothetical protein
MIFGGASLRGRWLLLLDRADAVIGVVGVALAGARRSRDVGRP